MTESAEQPLLDLPATEEPKKSAKRRTAVPARTPTTAPARARNASTPERPSARYTEKSPVALLKKRLREVSSARAAEVRASAR